MKIAIRKIQCSELWNPCSELLFFDSKDLSIFTYKITELHILGRLVS